jgi:hypothetical protein
MSEVVVQISADEALDASRLTNALDAFAKWSAEAGLGSDSADGPDIMMMTEHSGGQVRRKLIFQTREHAAHHAADGAGADDTDAIEHAPVLRGVAWAGRIARRARAYHAKLGEVQPKASRANMGIGAHTRGL